MSDDTDDTPSAATPDPAAPKRRRRPSRATAGETDKDNGAKAQRAAGRGRGQKAARTRTSSGSHGSPTESPSRQRRRRRTNLTPRQVRLLASGCAAALVLGSLGLAWQQGALDRAFAATQQKLLAASAEAGLAVERVLVTGRDQTDRTALRERLGARKGSPVLAFDPAAARARVVALPWVREAEVAVALPDTIELALTERQPVARWYHDGETRIVDDQGEVVSTAAPSAFGHLPRITGPKAAAAAPALVRLLAERPSLAEAVSHAERVSERRWDLHLERDVALRLPAEEPGPALDRFLALEAEHALTRRAVEAIDLRLEDRLIVRLGRDAAEHYGDDGLIHVGEDRP